MGFLPHHVYIVFISATIAAVLFLLWAFKDIYKNKIGIIAVAFVAWMLLQQQLATRGFYLKTDTMPPRMFYAVVPMLLLILALVIFNPTNFIERVSLFDLTVLHVVRIPVELVLLRLFQFGYVPQVMTFEGRNFDIWSGVTAIVFAWLALHDSKITRWVLLGWNFVALALLINIVTHAILSAPFRFQRISFDQPNIAVLYFPFIWLPSVIVPIVLFCHLVSIRRLMRDE
jgi:hypothetical protein